MDSIEVVPQEVERESLLLWESANWVIGVPLSFRASCWWGNFTQWCTALDEPSFNIYDRKGPLLVFRHQRTNGKWQLHPATGEFRDLHNRRTSWRSFLARHPEVVGAFVLPRMNPGKDGSTAGSDAQTR
jgi:hypothetical protein